MCATHTRESLGLVEVTKADASPITRDEMDSGRAGRQFGGSGSEPKIADEVLHLAKGHSSGDRRLEHLNGTLQR